jgi:hypothetical protein
MADMARILKHDDQGFLIGKRLGSSDSTSAPCDERAAPKVHSAPPATAHPEEVKAYLREIASRLSLPEGELPIPHRLWLAQRIDRILKGEDPRKALGLVRKRGDRSRTREDIRGLLIKIALHMFLHGKSRMAAADAVSEDCGYRSDHLRDFAAKHDAELARILAKLKRQFGDST